MRATLGDVVAQGGSLGQGQDPRLLGWLFRCGEHHSDVRLISSLVSVAEVMDQLIAH